jgi:hypothetical protein
MRKSTQKPCTQVTKMYKIPSKQLTFEDFDQPVGMKLDPKNRWVKKQSLFLGLKLNANMPNFSNGLKAM